MILYKYKKVSLIFRAPSSSGQGCQALDLSLKLRLKDEERNLNTAVRICPGLLFQ